MSLNAPFKISYWRQLENKVFPSSGHPWQPQLVPAPERSLPRLPWRPPRFPRGFVPGQRTPGRLGGLSSWRHFGSARRTCCPNTHALTGSHSLQRESLLKISPSRPGPPIAEHPIPTPNLPGALSPYPGRWRRAGAAAAERRPRALPWGRGPARPGLPGARRVSKCEFTHSA